VVSKVRLFSYDDRKLSKEERACFGAAKSSSSSSGKLLLDAD
jgi:hypothetical protein